MKLLPARAPVTPSIHSELLLPLVVILLGQLGVGGQRENGEDTAGSRAGSLAQSKAPSPTLPHPFPVTKAILSQRPMEGGGGGEGVLRTRLRWHLPRGPFQAF